ncbi:MAG TPA: hypothetical protein VHY22_13495 [Chthoniobacteraceae bacterium]|jgi:hypothetical protein|nr:hypothetical protein [Chthoniobacteraceae bacterium]
MNIAITIEDPSAKPGSASTMVQGGQLPITLTLDASPGSGAAFALALATTSSAPALVAYCDNFVQQDETTWTGMLDGTDSRLAAAMSGQETQPFGAQVSWSLNGGSPVICPNFTITVEQPNTTEPATSDGGPTYVTSAMLTAAIAALPTTGAEIGVLVTAWMASLPTALPATAGVAWMNGGQLSLS